jgi:hypothetical protein
VLVEEVDRLDAEALQTAVARRLTFAGDESIASRGSCPAWFAITRPSLAADAQPSGPRSRRAIHLSRVEEGCLNERQGDRGETLALSPRHGGRTSADHRHAAEAECRTSGRRPRFCVSPGVLRAGEQPPDGAGALPEEGSSQSVPRGSGARPSCEELHVRFGSVLRGAPQRHSRWKCVPRISGHPGQKWTRISNVARHASQRVQFEKMRGRARASTWPVCGLTEPIIFRSASR